MRRVTALKISVLIFAFLTINVQILSVTCWSNGGFSIDPSNPDYGTHDWIAHHALDWLPTKEKQFILANFPEYLYGTELPDNGGAPDGIGDTANNHVYYFANGSLQDDVSAVRAEEEYLSACNLFVQGDLTNAVKRLGVMTHYISDVAVFGHVMGSSTDWGAEVHHSDYETVVNEKTNDYDAEFNSFLVFDGVLGNLSAHDAAVQLAFDTTFDMDGNLTCVWMDENYDWHNPAFEARCGESLNLAVNLVADILHTFFLETESSAHFIPVPFHYQDEDYFCGPACLEMVFDYYGEDINQSEIADVSRSIGEPVYSTFTDELRRAAQFSNISTSGGDILPQKITGYTLRSLGYAAFENHGMTLAQIKDFISRDIPLILLMWYSYRHVSGHYRVVTGYNATHIFLHDPWNKPLWNGTYGGPNIAFNYTYFSDLWSYYGNWTLYASPWKINISAPSYMKPHTSFQINATITYPQSLPNSLSNYPASACNATITLPANLSLISGETSKKRVGDGSLAAGTNATVSWLIVANSSVTCTIRIEAEGIIFGSVWPHENYTAYNYRDRIGVTINFTITLKEDNTAPTIQEPIREPEGDVQPGEEVAILVHITDQESGVKNVTLSYTINDGTSWESLAMNYNYSTHLYEATIPGQLADTWVKFKIVACDYAGNVGTFDGIAPCCTYQVISEFSSSTVLAILMVFAMFIAIFMKANMAKQKHKRPSNAMKASPPLTSATMALG